MSCLRVQRQYLVGLASAQNAIAKFISTGKFVLNVDTSEGTGANDMSESAQAQKEAAKPEQFEGEPEASATDEGGREHQAHQPMGDFIAHTFPAGRVMTVPQCRRRQHPNSSNL